MQGPLAQAITLLETGDATRAREVLTDGFEELDADLTAGDQSSIELDLYVYLLGLSSYQLGETDEAIRWLESRHPATDSEVHADHAVLHSRLMLETFDPVGAVVELTRLSQTAPDAARRPDAQLILGLSFYEAGEIDRAREILAEIRHEPEASGVARVLSEMD